MMNPHYSRRQIISSLASGAASLAFSSSAKAGTNAFVVKDRIVTDPTVSVRDPDFDNFNYRATWFTVGSENNTDNSDNNLWVADIDPLTGNFVPFNGQGKLAGTTVVDGYNGPTWGFGASGPAVYFTKDVTGQTGALARSILVGNT